MARKGRGRFDTDEERVLQDGDVVFAQGDRSRELYVVQSGAVAIERVAEGRTIRLAMLQRGAIFGEMAFFWSHYRAARRPSRSATRGYWSFSPADF
ncbi:MAG: CRP/FNR family cyclic AMP-dependent transcriptional regulator [Myxococcota bacterium]